MGLFTEFFRDLPDGAFWPDGKFFKRLGQLLDRDRFRLESDSDEIQTDNGRFGIAGGGDGGAVKLLPFQIVPSDEHNNNGTIKNHRVRVVASLLVDDLPDDMHAGDAPPFYLSVSDGQIIYGRITIDDATGEVLSRTIENATTVPDDTGTDFHQQIGSVHIDAGGPTKAVNVQYGPIYAAILLNWTALPTDTDRYNVIWGSSKYTG